jgi:predicted ester cyclase
MFGQGKKTGIISATTDRMSPYVDRLTHNEKLRKQLAAAITNQVAARQRAKRRKTGFLGMASRFGSSPALRTQMLEAVSHVHKVRGRMQKTNHHTARNSMLALAGAGIVVAAVPRLRHTLADTLHRKGDDDWGSDLTESGLDE